LAYQSPPIKASLLQWAVIVSSNDQHWRGGQRESYKRLYGLPVGNLWYKLLSKWNCPVVSSAQAEKLCPDFMMMQAEPWTPAGA